MFRIAFKALAAGAVFWLCSSGLSKASAQSAPPFPFVGDGGINPHLVTQEAYEEAVEDLQMGNYEAAEKVFQKARPGRDNTYVHRWPHELDYAIGLSVIGQEKWLPAITTLKRAVRYDPRNHHARLVLGIAFLKVGDTHQANRQLVKFDRRVAKCTDTCEPALVNAADMLRAAIKEDV